MKHSDSSVSDSGSALPQAWVASVALAALAVLSGCTSAPGTTQTLWQERRIEDDATARVHVGMSRDEVRAVLGSPARIGTDARSRMEEWLWRYRRHNIADMCFYALFDQAGRVAQTATATEYSGGFYKPC